MKEVLPSIWSQKTSSNAAAAVLGISELYLSIVSNARFTNSSGCSIIISDSYFDVAIKGNITSTKRFVLDSLSTL